METPAVTATDILSAMHLTVESVYRDGPRFYVAHVKGDGEDFIFKAVIRDEPWRSPRTNDLFYPSDQLRTEIQTMKALAAIASRLAGPVPQIVASNEGAPTWMLRTYAHGLGMSEDSSPFVYKEAFYRRRVWKPVLDYILSVQQASDELMALLPHLSVNYYSSLKEKMAVVHLDRPTELLEPYADSLRIWMEGRGLLHDMRRTVVSHGQVYPPHIYLKYGRASLIDWENTSINNPYQDLVAMWIRGFDDTDWQDTFMAELIRRRVITTDLDRELWRTEVMLQSAGNLNYFFWSRHEPAAVQARAIASLRRNVENVLLGMKMSDVGYDGYV